MQFLLLLILLRLTKTEDIVSSIWAKRKQIHSPVFSYSLEFFSRRPVFDQEPGSSYQLLK